MQPRVKPAPFSTSDPTSPEYDQGLCRGSKRTLSKTPKRRNNTYKAHRKTYSPRNIYLYQLYLIDPIKETKPIISFFLSFLAHKQYRKLTRLCSYIQYSRVLQIVVGPIIHKSFILKCARFRVTLFMINWGSRRAGVADEHFFIGSNQANTLIL